jgi:hypothetical protein
LASFHALAGRDLPQKSARCLGQYLHHVKENWNI